MFFNKKCWCKINNSFQTKHEKVQTPIELNRCTVCLLQAEGVGHIVLHNIIHRAWTSCYSRACIAHRCSWYIFIVDGAAPNRAVCESDLCLRLRYNRIYKGRLSNYLDITLCIKKLDWALSKSYFIWGIQHYQIKKKCLTKLDLNFFQLLFFLC